MRTYQEVIKGGFFDPQIYKQHIYTVNDEFCLKAKCESHILQLLNTEPEISLRKILTVETDTHTHNYRFGLILNSLTIKLIKNSGDDNYKKLIADALSMLDSAVLAEKNFKKYAQTFEKKLYDFFLFFHGFTIEKNALFFDEIQQMYTEYNVLLFTNSVFAMSRMLSEENTTYHDHFGNDCMPKIVFPSSSGNELNIHDAKQFIENIFIHIPTNKRHLEESPCYCPSIRDASLETLDKIKAMAQKYTEIFNETPTENIGRTLS